MTVGHRLGCASRRCVFSTPSRGAHCGVQSTTRAIQKAVCLAARHSPAHYFPMTATKATLAITLFAQLGLNKREANDMVDHFFEQIAAALEAGDVREVERLW